MKASPRREKKNETKPINVQLKNTVKIKNQNEKKVTLVTRSKIAVGDGHCGSCGGRDGNWWRLVVGMQLLFFL